MNRLAMIAFLLILPVMPLAQTPPPPAAQTPRLEMPLEPSIFDRYIGRYQFAPAVLLTVSREGTHFFAQLTDQPAFEIFAASEKEFFLKVVDAQLTFEVSPPNKATAVVLHQNGLNQRAIRIEGDPVMPKAIALDPAIFDRYVGRYQLTPAVTITVSRDGQRFLGQLTGQPPAEIFAESERRFFLKVVDARLTFEADATGRATAVVLQQNGAEQRAPRNDLPTAIVLEAPVLDRYVGKYQIGPDVVMTIRRQESRLFGQPTGQSEQELFASSPREFFLMTIDAQIVFEVDAAGKTTGLVLRQNGRDFRAPRID